PLPGQVAHHEARGDGVAPLPPPHARIMVYAKRGADLRRELKWLGSYRYAVANLGAASPESLAAAYRAIHRDIGFHPRGRLDVPEAMLGEAAAD
ncbi:MAG: hypothetical protein K8F93_02885, partial [Burkholderiales bacterium]|nr:hypothetical protein [Burkholderiales bacterium]